MLGPATFYPGNDLEATVTLRTTYNSVPELATDAQLEHLQAALRLRGIGGYVQS